MQFEIIDDMNYNVPNKFNRNFRELFNNQEKEKNNKNHEKNSTLYKYKILFFSDIYLISIILIIFLNIIIVFFAKSITNSIQKDTLNFENVEIKKFLTKYLRFNILNNVYFKEYYENLKNSSITYEYFSKIDFVSLFQKAKLLNIKFSNYLNKDISNFYNLFDSFFDDRIKIQNMIYNEINDTIINGQYDDIQIIYLKKNTKKNKTINLQKYFQSVKMTYNFLIFSGFIFFMILAFFKLKIKSYDHILKKLNYFFLGTMILMYCKFLEDYFFYFGLLDNYRIILNMIYNLDLLIFKIICLFFRIDSKVLLFSFLFSEIFNFIHLFSCSEIEFLNVFLNSKIMLKVIIFFLNLINQKQILSASNKFSYLQKINFGLINTLDNFNFKHSMIDHNQSIFLNKKMSNSLLNKFSKLNQSEKNLQSKDNILYDMLNYFKFVFKDINFQENLPIEIIEIIKEIQFFSDLFNNNKFYLSASFSNKSFDLHNKLNNYFNKINNFIIIAKNDKQYSNKANKFEINNKVTECKNLNNYNEENKNFYEMSNTNIENDLEGKYILEQKIKHYINILSNKLIFLLDEISSKGSYENKNSCENNKFNYFNKNFDESDIIPYAHRKPQRNNKINGKEENNDTNHKLENKKENVLLLKNKPDFNNFILLGIRTKNKNYNSESFVNKENKDKKFENTIEYIYVRYNRIFKGMEIMIQTQKNSYDDKKIESKPNLIDNENLKSIFKNSYLKLCHEFRNAFLNMIQLTKTSKNLLKKERLFDNNLNITKMNNDDLSKFIDNTDFINMSFESSIKVNDNSAKLNLKKNRLNKINRLQSNSYTNSHNNQDRLISMESENMTNNRTSNQNTFSRKKVSHNSISDKKYYKTDKNFKFDSSNELKIHSFIENVDAKVKYVNNNKNYNDENNQNKYFLNLNEKNEEFIENDHKKLKYYEGLKKIKYLCSFLDYSIQEFEQLSNLISIDTLDDLIIQLKNKSKLNICEVDLREEMKNIFKIINAKISLTNLNIKFKYIISEEIPNIVFFDIDLLKKILFILLNNSMKFTRNGEISLFVSIIRNLLHFQINDTGVGIKKEDLLHVGELFFKIKNPINSFGNGIGLFFFKLYIFILEGEFEINSVNGIGTNISFYFPSKQKSDLINYDFSDSTKIKNEKYRLFLNNKYLSNVSSNFDKFILNDKLNKNLIESNTSKNSNLQIKNNHSKNSIYEEPNSTNYLNKDKKYKKYNSHSDNNFKSLILNLNEHYYENLNEILKKINKTEENDNKICDIKKSKFRKVDKIEENDRKINQEIIFYPENNITECSNFIYFEDINIVTKNNSFDAKIELQKDFNNDSSCLLSINEEKRSLKSYQICERDILRKFQTKIKSNYVNNLARNHSKSFSPRKKEQFQMNLSYHMIKSTKKDFSTELNLSKKIDSFFSNRITRNNTRTLSIDEKQFLNINYNEIGYDSNSNDVLSLRINTKSPRPEKNVRKYHFLFVDDELLIRKSNANFCEKYFKKLYSDTDYQLYIDESSDGIEALYKIYESHSKGFRYDAIITDENMNFMKGSFMAKIIKLFVKENIFYDIILGLLTSCEFSSICDSKILENFDISGTKPISKSFFDRLMDVYQEK